MKPCFSLLGLLAGLALTGLSHGCDPEAPFVPDPYDGETTKNLETVKRLTHYWSDNTYFKLSDDSEATPAVQCKNVCDSGSGGRGKREVEKVSSTCNFGKNLWSSYNSGKPLLCGTDKDFQGTFTIIHVFGKRPAS